MSRLRSHATAPIDMVVECHDANLILTLHPDCYVTYRTGECSAGRADLRRPLLRSTRTRETFRGAASSPPRAVMKVLNSNASVMLTTICGDLGG